MYLNLELQSTFETYIPIPDIALYALIFLSLCAPSKVNIFNQAAS